ncbi:hypothetical protein [Borreliella andersonii]
MKTNGSIKINDPITSLYKELSKDFMKKRRYWQSNKVFYFFKK